MWSVMYALCSTSHLGEMVHHKDPYQNTKIKTPYSLNHVWLSIFSDQEEALAGILLFVFQNGRLGYRKKD